MNDTLSVRRIPLSVWMLGFVSMLMDMSSELIHSLLPVFMVSVLGASVLTVGFIEGVAESIALIVKIFSGTLSDYLGKRKTLALIGYGLGACSKPLFAIASSTGIIFAARFIDRVGKGIRGAPRDALVADITAPEIRGAAYGLRQALDTVGAFTGPLLAIVLMLLWENDFRRIFWLAVIPGALSVVLLFFAVHEPQPAAQVKAINPIHRRELARLSGAYWWVVVIGAIFTLARFSEAFLVLRVQQGGMPLSFAPLVLVAMNVIYAAFAYPSGKLSDSIDHRKLLVIGLIILIAADVVLAYAHSWQVMMAGVMLWGLHLGITQGLLATMVADTALPELRGTAFGLFNLISGFAMLVASITAGWLWDQFGAPATFYAGVLFCVMALLAVGYVREESDE